MKKGTKVTWTTKDGKPGAGEVLTDEENGHVLVSVEKMHDEEQEVHVVIRCTTTWLTEVFS